MLGPEPRIFPGIFILFKIRVVVVRGREAHDTLDMVLWPVALSALLATVLEGVRMNKAGFPRNKVCLPQQEGIRDRGSAVLLHSNRRRRLELDIWAR